MNNLKSVSSKNDIPTDYQGNPIGLLLEYHNLNRELDNHKQAHLLIGMCMDNRIRLRIPDNFAFVLRTGGMNLRFNEFHISYAISVGDVRLIALIGHTQCGMVNLSERRTQFVKGLVEANGWEYERAEEYFLKFS